MLDVADAIRSGTFGDPNVFSALLDTVFGSGRDYYVRCRDSVTRADSTRSVWPMTSTRTSLRKNSSTRSSSRCARHLTASR